jgi:predicted dehydrogenase
VEDVRIEGDAGAIVLEQDPERGDLLRLITAVGERKRPAYDGAPIDAYRCPYVAAQRHFIECLLTGKTPETNGEDNLNTLTLTLAAYHSAEFNTVVNVKDFKDWSKE